MVLILAYSLDTLVDDIKSRHPEYPWKILKQSEICETNKKFDDKKFSILKNGKSR